MSIYLESNAVKCTHAYTHMRKAYGNIRCRRNVAYNTPFWMQMFLYVGLLLACQAFSDV